MTQIAIVQPTVPQAPQSNPSSVEESDSFSSHLDDALAKTSEKNSSNSTQDKANTAGVNEPKESDVTKVTEENTATAPPDDKSDKSVDNISETRKSIPDTPLNSFINPLFSTDPASPASVTLKNGVAESALSTLKSSLLPIEAENSYILPETDQDSITIPKSLSAVLQNNTIQTQGSYQETLQTKLQQIIENSSETGIVSITKTNNSPGIGVLSQLYGTEQIVASTSDSTESSFFKTSNAELFGINTKPEQATQQATSLRQNVQNQYYDAKMSVQNIGDQKDAPQDNSQDMKNAPQQQSSSLQNNQPTPANPSGNEFSILTGAPQNNSTPPLVIDPARITVLPSGLVVHEDDVVQQLVERFQVSRRQLDSRVSIKLHPAELGELNISLSVKEGSVRAHVVAQSQHVQEIIEKNIAKLKTVLEDQGFSVAEISIRSESESVGDFDLFDQQLFSNNDYEPQMKKDNSRMGIPFTIDDIEMEAGSDGIGVNVTA